jgi:hypothetical protein
MKNAYYQPRKILNLRFSLFWTQFTNSLNPSTIGFVDRHWNLQVKSFVAKQLYPISSADQYSFLKLSGR